MQVPVLQVLLRLTGLGRVFMGCTAIRIIVADSMLLSLVLLLFLLSLLLSSSSSSSWFDYIKTSILPSFDKLNSSLTGKERRNAFLWRWDLWQLIRLDVGVKCLWQIHSLFSSLTFAFWRNGKKEKKNPLYLQILPHSVVFDFPHERILFKHRRV